MNKNLDTLTISIMKISDYEEAYKLWNNTEGMGLRSLDDSRDGIDKFLKRNPTTNFVCRVKNELVGVILCGHDGRRGYIYHAVVDAKYRKIGIGKNLVNSVISSLEEEGIKKVALVVYSNNNEGNKFWNNLGFLKRDDLFYRNKVIDINNI